MQFLDTVRSFFFKAMLEGWAAGVPKIKIPDMPGYKAIPYREGDFYLLDRYCVVSDSLKSAGTTTIWFHDVPVWVMNYGGLYEEDAIPFLKRALLKTYENHQFIGGRGPLVYSEESLVYVNRPCLNATLDKFKGREEVFDVGNEISLGFHEYSGMSLL